MTELSGVGTLLARLRGRDVTVAVAESLTGGLLCAALTEPAGASTVVRGGLVVYSTDLKVALAGVDADLLSRHGAVHPDVARELARGARDRLDATLGAGLTGVAGPDPQDGIAVGTVFAAISGPAGERVRAFRFDGTRSQIRAASVDACIGLLAREWTACAGALRSP